MVIVKSTVADVLTMSLCIAALTACGQSTASDADAQTRRSPSIQGASAEHPVVVELYQSQGCSSCPPADANVNALAQRLDVLALSFAVTYWDQLGWKDTFGSPKFTARQWDYARHAGRSQVATPQVIINGGPAIVGSNPAQLDSVIAKLGPPRNGPPITADGPLVKIGVAPTGAPATVWLVRYDPRTHDVAIRAGENGGRRIPHRNIVRQLVSIGQWSGKAQYYPLSASPNRHFATAVLVQRGTGGPIIAARKL